MEGVAWISLEAPRTNCLSLTRHGGTLFRKNKKNENVGSDGNQNKDFNGFEDFFSEGPREFPVCEEEVSPDDPFRVLGLKRSASDEDIKTKYRELILIHHPDKGGDHDEFIRIQEAYETLK